MALALHDVVPDPALQLIDTDSSGISSANTDLAVVGVMLLLTALLLLVPFIPGLRDIPRWIPIHKLIWRRHYADMRRRSAAATTPNAP